MEELTYEQLQVKYAELVKTNQSNEARINELEESNKTLASEKIDLQKANMKLFAMIDTPTPQDNNNDDVDEPEPIDYEKALNEAIGG